MLSPEEIEELLSERGGRTGLIDERFRWTDNIVPYYVNRSHFSNDIHLIFKIIIIYKLNIPQLLHNTITLHSAYKESWMLLASS